LSRYIIQIKGDDLSSTANPFKILSEVTDQQ